MLSKTIKVLFVGLALVMSSSVFAQTKVLPVKKQNPDRSEFLENELNLTSEQIQSFNTYFAEYSEALKKVRMEKTSDRSVKTDQMALAKEDYYKKLSGLLSKEQLAKYLAVYDGSSKSTNRIQKVDYD